MIKMLLNTNIIDIMLHIISNYLDLDLDLDNPGNSKISCAAYFKTIFIDRSD